MATRNLHRGPNKAGNIKGSSNAAPIYCDSDDSILKFIPGGEGSSTEVQIIDASSAQTLTNKTISGLSSSTTGVIQAAGGVITELNGDGAYSISVTLPAGAVIVDLIITGVALWTAGTSATLVVGDTDDDGFFTAINAKTTPAVGTSLKTDTVPAGTGDGTYLGDTNGEFVGPAVSNFGRYYAAGGTITAKITKAGTGTAGRTQFTVLYVVPTTVAQVVV